ncbi:hypothetical protein [uncultured Shewanella sp.]|uniref:hypothetical protein n=1 Tax=uncultured Shewanella sp. TaxID=173975 RepID=UPI002609A023|nr:hypothetical protein [uncultured Shewanella sp.]
MSEDNLLSYLNDYVSEPKVLNLSQLTLDEQKLIPQSWLSILALEGKERFTKALSYWQPIASEMSEVLFYLDNNIVSIDLVHHQYGYCLVYGVISEDDPDITYYEARNPKTMQMSSAVADSWLLLPENMRQFYEQFHNGWYCLASGSMGLSPVEDFFFLADEEWGILDDIDMPPVDLSKTLAVYTNGAGGYLCFEFKDSKDLSALLWWSSDAPMLDLNFWDVADEWTLMGFE